MDSLWKHKLQSKQIRVKTDSSTLPPPSNLSSSPSLHQPSSLSLSLSTSLSLCATRCLSPSVCICNSYVSGDDQFSVSVISGFTSGHKEVFFALVLEKKSTRVCSLVALESQNWIQLTCKCLLFHNQGYHVEYWGAVILLSSAKPSH